MKRGFRQLIAPVGQSMVETALVLPFILLLVFGVFEFGRIIFIFSALNNASREAARFGAAAGVTESGSVHYLDCDAIRQRARETAFLAGLSDGEIQIAYDRPDIATGTMSTFAHCGDVDLDRGDIRQGDRIVITINRDIEPVVTFLPLPVFSPTFSTARSILKSIVIGPVQCSDGVDNDGDGATDYPDDTGCTGPDDTREAPCWRLSVFTSPIDGGTLAINPGSNCANRYIEGTTVNLRASVDLRNDPQISPRPLYTFDSWTGDIVTTDNPTTVLMDDDKNVTANFRPVQADLEVIKTSSPEPVRSEQPLRYAVHVKNLGPDWASEVEIIDTLPADVIYEVDDWSSPDGIVCDDSEANEGERNIVCTLDWLEEGKTAILYIDTTAPVANGGPMTIENKVTVSATEDDPPSDPDNNTFTLESTVEPYAELSIEKEGPEGTVWADTTFDYIIHVTNHGPSTATNVVVTDPLDTDLTFVSSDQCDYDGGSRIVTCEITQITRDDTATVEFTVRTPDEEATVANTATVTATEAEEQISEDIPTDVDPHADLSITKFGPASVARDQVFQYSLTVTNNGPSTATGVSVVDTLPAGVNYVSTPGDICSVTGNTVTCPLSDLAPGAISNVTLNVEATDDTENETPLENTATVSSAIEDLIPGNDSDSVETAVFIDVQLAVDKRATASTVKEDEVFSYIIDVGNEGASTANGVVLTDSLPDHVEFVDIDDGDWSCNTGSLPTITCSPPGDILPGGETETIRIEVRATGVGGINNTATLDSDETDSVSDSTNVTSEAAFDLTVEISGPASGTVDTPFDFTVSIVNSGPSDVSQAQVTIYLDSNVTRNDASGNGWICDPASPTVVVCDLTGAIAGGASSNITVNITPNAAGDVTNEATVESTGEATTTNNSASLTTPVEPAPE